MPAAPHAFTLISDSAAFPTASFPVRRAAARPTRLGARYLIALAGCGLVAAGAGMFAVAALAGAVLAVAIITTRDARGA